jgi:BASS family bile acid:Na+ symporter
MKYDSLFRIRNLKYLMDKFRLFLRNRDFTIIIAIISGMFFQHAAQWTRHLVLPLLSLIMTLSILDIDSQIFRPSRSLIFPAFFGIVMNYAILGNLIIFMSAFLVYDESFWIGFVTLAAVPSAVAVIQFTRLLNGNETYATIGTIGTHIGALLIIPLIALGLLDIQLIDTTKLFAVTIALIALPIAASRLVICKQLNNHIKPVKGMIMDWSFFLVLYTIIGLNRDIIIGHPFTLVPMIIIAIASTFLLGFLIQWVGILFHINKANLTALFLFGTLKNYGLAGGLALYIFSTEAALPAAVFTIIMVIYVKWLDFKIQQAKYRLQNSPSPIEA